MKLSTEGERNPGFLGNEASIPQALIAAKKTAGRSGTRPQLCPPGQLPGAGRHRPPGRQPAGNQASHPVGEDQVARAARKNLPANSVNFGLAPLKRHLRPVPRRRISVPGNAALGMVGDGWDRRSAVKRHAFVEVDA